MLPSTCIACAVMFVPVPFRPSFQMGQPPLPLPPPTYCYECGLLYRGLRYAVGVTAGGHVDERAMPHVVRRAAETGLHDNYAEFYREALALLRGAPS